MKKEERYFCADTESTQPRGKWEVEDFKTRVWGCGIGEVGGAFVNIFDNMEAMFDDVLDIAKDYTLIIFFHNLAWDGSLIVDWLIREKGYRVVEDGKRLAKNTLTTTISDRGQWYQLKFNWKGYTYILRDSLKLLPFKVEAIAKSFGTKHKKLKGSIDYKIERPEGWKITDTERRYIENDIFVMMEALEAVKDYGLLDHLTIGATCLDYYKKITGKEYDILFPELTEELDKDIRKSYRGGWCYVKKNIENKILRGVNGYTYDVNSLYPYAMSSKQYEGDNEHIYPVGDIIAEFDDTNFEDYELDCYFVEIEAEFHIKENHLPFLQIKHSYFKENEYLEDSDGIQIITLTRPDYELFHEQYNVTYEKILHGWVFAGRRRIFDDYINHWYKVKAEATKEGNKVKRQLAKLFLNNLYGKLATSLIADSKIPYYDKEADKIKWEIVEDTKKGVYIPAGAYVTAYARCKTVRAAQRNYDIFCYADTDSIHTTGEADGIAIDPVELGAWANEARWNCARFVRQKTYIEHLTHEDGKEIDPVWNIKACGAPENVKIRIQYKVEIDEELDKDEDGNIINYKYDDDEFMERFTYGLVESGKMGKKQVTGGTILYNTTFQIHQ